MDNHEFQQKIKRIAYSSILFCCSIMLLGLFFVLAYLNIIPFNTSNDNLYGIDLDFVEPYEAYFDVSLF